MPTPPHDDDRPPGLLRRRIVFELSIEQLPLLEEAERRHGTKRQALVRALEAEAQLIDLQQALAAAEAQLAEAQAARELAENAAASAVKAAGKKGGEATTKRASAQLAAEKERWASERRRLEADIQTLERLLDEQTDELDAHQARAVDELFCARCGSWIAPEHWRWRESETGEIAYHAPCGDHGPGLLGASWLAYRGN